jgi:hypothetical protein
MKAALICKKKLSEDPVSHLASALFQMGPLKVSGPDGFPARFFQRNWELMMVLYL